ncbi:TonB-dependent receptor [Sphingomonas sp. CGMCC 1.13654]|uniref:TonB-dependent receptor n=1 Tax=Sphingomonas chungangi TaxID=2683589 RepID=A0A838L256_9SPHN|nr:TonB-dependent receptor [Sphingomonas chungangi]MBA2933583.1 TonB-dependent receptor [Sphingomonas chungangi]
MPKIKGSRPSFEASVSFKPSNQITTYATISTGYRAPYQNANVGYVSQVNPNDIAIPAGATSDKLTNYEVGAKGRFFNGPLNAAVSLYYITWNNIEVNANRVSDQIQFATNIGGARSRGIEFDLASNPNKLFSFGANGSYGGTEITKLTAEQASISGAVKGDRLSASKF